MRKSAGCGISLVLLLGLATAQGMAQVSRNPGAMRPGGRPGMVPRPGIRPNQAFERFNKMTPQQRQRAMENLSPERRKQFEERLEQYRKLSPREQQQLASRYEQFQQLPPEKQETLRRLYRRFNSFPEERRSALRDEVRELARLPESERSARMNSDEFRSQYSQQEQTILRNFASSLPQPQSQPE